MDTPIDFGKNFLHALYRERDIDKTMQFLSDDIVWITPEEMLHLRTRREIRDFVAASMGEDQQPYNVDIAAIKSAPVSGDTNTIAYDVNLIPRREQNAKNLRVSLTIHKKAGSQGYELVFIGMSRKYERSESDQLQGFMENLPSGLLVLAGFGTNSFRELYANTYFAQKLGYPVDEFYDLSDNNPFFMVAPREQRRMVTLVNEMISLSHPKPISVQVNLVNAKGEELPFQVITKAAYKDKGGTRTILYLLFSDLTEILTEQARAKKRLEARARRQNKTEEKADRTDAETLRLREEAEAMQEKAAAQLDDIDKLMNAAKEACENAERDAQAAADAEIAKIRQQAEEEIAKIRQQAEEEIAKTRQQTEEMAKVRQETAEEKAAAEKEDEEKINGLEEQLAGVRTELATARTDLSTAQTELAAARNDLEEERLKAHDRERTLREEIEDQYKKENETRLAEVSRKAQQEESALNQKIDELKADAEGTRQGFLIQIRRYQERLAQSDQAQRRNALEAEIAAKEQNKTAERLSYLLDGQMNAVHSLTEAAAKDLDPKENPGEERPAAILQQIGKLCTAVPGMAADLTAVARLDPSGRSLTEETFSLSECLTTVIKVIRPQCRRKGVVFTCDTDGQVPDHVHGNKAGLQLAFLCILENAVHGTAQGGRIRLVAQADRAVRGSCYFHFTITDTGTGIPDDKLPSLFDNPSGELSIARKIVSAMGGSIQVRSTYGSGSRFEISVNLKIEKH